MNLLKIRTVSDDVFYIMPNMIKAVKLNDEIDSEDIHTKSVTFYLDNNLNFSFENIYVVEAKGRKMVRLESNGSYLEQKYEWIDVDIFDENFIETLL